MLRQFLTRSFAQKHRHGTTTVETAFVLPVFLLIVFAIMEFGHAQLVLNTLNGSCRTGARLGAIEGITTPQVVAHVEDVLSAVCSSSAVSIFVKDASVYDSPNIPPTSGSGVEALPNMDLTAAEPRDMFVVRASVPYNDIAIIPFSFLDGVVLNSQSFMRHE